ncbi:MAG: hemerythrin domain-containing protein [Burkholderiales bacterium]|nr:hemerythrin domain-containing protein [Burkholderiales bacterium]
MSTITATLTADHRCEDRLLAAARQAADEGDWSACALHFDAFLRSIKDHMKIEEEALFPAFERASGVSGGPTSVMRREHRQMLTMLDGIAGVLGARDAREFHALAGPFAALMAAHSIKEERVLYPLCDEMLPGLDGEQLTRMVSLP